METAYLGHLQRDNLGEGLLGSNFTVILAENPSLSRRNAVVLDPLVSEDGLVLAEGDSGNVAAKVLRGVSGEGSPSTTNVEEGVGRLEFELVADEGELVVLEFFETFFAVDVVDDSRSVDHARSKEPE